MALRKRKFEPPQVTRYGVFANVSASATVPRPLKWERVAAGRVRVVGKTALLLFTVS
jgi:hypothetical protein